MAQKRKRNSNKKWVTWVFLLVILVVAGVIVYLVWDSYFRDKDDEDKNKQQEVEQVEKRDEVEKKEEKSDDGVTGKEKVEQYDGEDPNSAEMLSGVVTYAGVSGGKLMIRVNIDQYLESGRCELTLERGGTVIYSDEANVVGNVSTSTCEGFDVLLDKLGSGVIGIGIKVNSGERSGTIHGEVSV